MVNSMSLGYEDFKEELDTFKNGSITPHELCTAINKKIDAVMIAKISDYEKVVKRYENKEISKETALACKAELEKYLKELGAEVKQWNVQTERNPLNDGRSASIFGFTYNPTFNERGRFFQSVIKRGMRFSIDLVWYTFKMNPDFWTSRFFRKIILKLMPYVVGFTHQSIIQRYNDRAYSYEDNRFKELDRFAKAYFYENFYNWYPNNYIMMCQVCDIVLEVAKSDVEYGVKLFDFYNKFQAKYGEIEILPAEKRYLETFNRENQIKKDREKVLCRLSEIFNDKELQQAYTSSIINKDELMAEVEKKWSKVKIGNE